MAQMNGFGVPMLLFFACFLEYGVTTNKCFKRQHENGDTITVFDCPSRGDPAYMINCCGGTNHQYCCADPIINRPRRFLDNYEKQHEKYLDDLSPFIIFACVVAAVVGFVLICAFSYKCCPRLVAANRRSNEAFLREKAEAEQQARVNETLPAPHNHIVPCRNQVSCPAQQGTTYAYPAQQTTTCTSTTVTLGHGSGFPTPPGLKCMLNVPQIKDDKLSLLKNAI